MKRTAIVLAALMLFASAELCAQDAQINTGINKGQDRVRLAAADFKSLSNDAVLPPLLQTFNTTLFSDLDNAGIFDMVSKSFYPLEQPGSPNEMKLDAWNVPPPNTAMVAFGNLNVQGGELVVAGWLFDVKNSSSPLVMGKQYKGEATDASARSIAHKFADEIIQRLGGGIAGIAESQIVFISNRTGNKEVWMMDYDGANQRQITTLGSISLSPRISPDGSRIAFSSYAHGGPHITMYSLELNRFVSFPRFEGTNNSPAWSPDGTKLAFSSSMRGSSEIFISDISGNNPKRVTAFTGGNLSPAFNPKTGAQIAFVSGRTGLPQIYLMDADGTNTERLTDTGYAVSPSWSPNGQYLTFAWRRKYGPGVPGSQDIYVMDAASRKWVQLTFDSGVNDFPCWSPDGRHIVFESIRDGRAQIWTMLADGTQQKALTTAGQNFQPNWSFK